MGSPGVILLDTHVWIWLLADPDSISTPAMAAVRGAEDPGAIIVSAISVWELWMLVKKGRLELDASPEAFLHATVTDARFRIEPADESISRRSVELPDIHADPADRLILATAARLGCPVVSKDGRFREYDLVPVVW